MRIDRCFIDGAGETGIAIVGSKERSTGLGTVAFPRRCIVSNSTIQDIGQVVKGSAGVYIARAADITVADTAVRRVPRSCITLADGWAGGAPLPSSLSSGLDVLFFRVSSTDACVDRAYLRASRSPRRSARNQRPRASQASPIATAESLSAYPRQRQGPFNAWGRERFWPETFFWQSDWGPMTPPYSPGSNIPGWKGPSPGYVAAGAVALDTLRPITIRNSRIEQYPLDSAKLERAGLGPSDIIAVVK